MKVYLNEQGMNQQNGNALLVTGYLREAIQDCPFLL